MLHTCEYVATTSTIKKIRMKFDRMYQRSNFNTVCIKTVGRQARRNEGVDARRINLHSPEKQVPREFIESAEERVLA